MSPKSLQDLLDRATTTLAAAGIQDAARDARRLMAFVLNLPAHEIAFQRDRVLTLAEQGRFGDAIQARAAHKPVSKIIGQRSFWKHDFLVTNDTLDPRPETEMLVAEALSHPFATMLDLGTGTGCILISCLLDRPQAQGTGTDLSAAALAVATRNAQHLGAAPRAHFLQADWFNGVSGRFDLIVSNPPYIAADEMALLSPDVHAWDPHLALSPGGDGLAAYRRIAEGAAAHLVASGRLLLEIGPTQGQAVVALLAAHGFAAIRILPDLDGRDRVVACQLPDPR